MSMNLYGEDTGTLLQIAEEAVRRLRGIPGLLAVDIDTERGESIILTTNNKRILYITGTGHKYCANINL
jgi:Cu/Ag efflux pump CusA